MTGTSAVRERLHSDIVLLTQDVDELLRATEAEAPNGLSSSWQRIFAALVRKGKTLGITSKRGADAAVEFARDNRWSAGGMAIGAATILGLLVWNEFMK